MNENDPVFINPYDEGYQAAREGRATSSILALPALMMGDQLAYSDYDWQQFLLGALKYLMEHA